VTVEERLEKLMTLLNQLLASIAVMDEKMLNRVTKEDLSKAVRELEKEIRDVLDDVIEKGVQGRERMGQKLTEEATKLYSKIESESIKHSVNLAEQMNILRDNIAQTAIVTRNQISDLENKHNSLDDEVGEMRVDNKGTSTKTIMMYGLFIVAAGAVLTWAVNKMLGAG